MITDEIFYRHFTLVQQENRIYAEWCKKRGISYTWLIILDTMLRAEKDIEPAMLSDTLFIPRQTITSLLDQLEKNGLIRREPHPADRRRKLVSLTPAGREFAREVVETIFEKERIAMEVLTSEEQEQLLAMYGRLQHGFETSFLAEK